MTTQELIALLFAGGLGAVLKTIVDALVARANSTRQDRQQKADEAKQKADSSRTLVESAEKVVLLQNEQIDDLKKIITEQQDAFQKRLDAQGAALSAYETRLDREMEARRKADVIAADLREQLTRLRDELSLVKAEFKLTDQTLQELRGENQALRDRLFAVSLGVAALVKQVLAAGLEPAYTLEVPAGESNT